MDEDKFNMSIRKFLKEVGVTSQREIEAVVREGRTRGNKLRVRMTLTADGTDLNHVVDGEINLS
jgi:16S rRNA U516 pseudouridylate synthase RsuA-like enzyme